MPKDPYGNEIEDPFDKAIAQGVMRSTWSSAVVSLVFALGGGCCVPIGSMVSPNAMLVVMSAGALLAIAAGINVVIRVFTMQPEHRALVPSWHPWTAFGMGVVGAGLGCLQLFGAVASFVVAAWT